MPLLDHFHAPLIQDRHWESFHAFWAMTIAEWFNRRLPRRYFAEVQVHLGSRIEADVAEFEVTSIAEPVNGEAGGVAVQTWTIPAATMAMSAVFPDDIEVHIRDEQDFRRLVAVVELVSPGNKDRDKARRAFAAKCATYLQHGVGLVMVDIVTSRHANLHNELIHVLGQQGSFLLPEDVALFAVAYRPGRRDDVSQIEMWPAPLTVGGTLPLLPLALRGAGFVPLDLEVT